MGEIILTMQMSLDGIVSQPEEWMILSDEILEDHVAYYGTVDAVVLGGNTHDGLARYWTEAEVSSASPMERALARRLNDLPKFIPTCAEIDLTWRNAKAIRVTGDESFVRAQHGQDLRGKRNPDVAPLSPARPVRRAVGAGASRDRRRRRQAF